MAKKSNKKFPLRQDPKTRAVTVLFSEEEYKMINYYVEKHKYSSRSAYIRRLVMVDVLEQLNANFPTLFDQPPIDK